MEELLQLQQSAVLVAVQAMGLAWCLVRQVFLGKATLVVQKVAQTPIPALAAAAQAQQVAMHLRAKVAWEALVYPPAFLALQRIMQAAAAEKVAVVALLAAQAAQAVAVKVERQLRHLIIQ